MNVEKIKLSDRHEKKTIIKTKKQLLLYTTRKPELKYLIRDYIG